MSTSVESSASAKWSGNLARSCVRPLALVAALTGFGQSVWAGEKDRYDSVFSWRGWYVGLTVGGGWGQSKFEDDVPPPSNFFDINGSVVGATLGFNVQFHPNWVAGIEADISYSDIGGRFGPGNLRTPIGTTWTCAPGACETDVTWFGTMRGRLGYTSDRLLIFGTGGLAFGQVDSGVAGAPTFQADDTNFGWTAGAGFEYAFASGWSAKVEYLHGDLGWTERTGFFRSDAEFDVVRAGINYRIGN